MKNNQDLPGKPDAQTGFAPSTGSDTGALIVAEGYYRQKARADRAESALESLHDWMLEKAPEHYRECGLWIDVEIILGRKKPEDFDDDLPNAEMRDDHE